MADLPSASISLYDPSRPFNRLLSLCKYNQDILQTLRHNAEAHKDTNLGSLLRKYENHYKSRRKAILNQTRSRSLALIQNHLARRARIGPCLTRPMSQDTAGSRLRRIMLELQGGTLIEHYVDPRTIGNNPNVSYDDNQIKAQVTNWLRHSEVIHSGRMEQLILDLGSRHLGQYSLDTFLIKVGTSAAIKNEFSILSEIKAYIPHICSPICQFYAQIGSVYILVMHRLPGTPLDCIWSSLTTKDHESIASQLRPLLHGMRHGTAVHSVAQRFGNSDAEGVVDYRGMQPMLTEEDVYSPTDHNCTFKASSSEIQYSQWLIDPKSYPKAFTHGNLIPKNILVVRKPHKSDHQSNRNYDYDYNDVTRLNQSHEYSCQVTGILSWEAAGVLPEYWEYVKAVSNVPPNQKLIWSDSIGQCVGRYEYEEAVNRIQHVSSFRG